ncbi:MAG: helix-turn-helix transcriptional regulator [Lachnobacterium sp.]|nr:helix-turn-helix transcriptional regulator [Lachnobacterium sp.]
MINVLERITELREAHHWTEYQLAERSGLTQSTISSWYRKQMLPTIPSLVKICDAFGVTLSQFFLEDNEQAIHLTDRQSALLAASSKLTPEQYNALLAFLEQL